ncbi:MAG: methyltransferase [Planctomycetota bacterium]|nr:methyltransferase [Planctomycetota bacterium]
MTADKDPALDPSAMMMDKILSYCRSQGIGAVARLGLPDLLAESPRTAAELAAACGADPDYLQRMLRALSVEGIFEARGDGVFALNELSEVLTTGHPRSVRWLAASMCDHAHWQPWGKAFDALVEGKSQTPRVLGMSPWEYLSGNPEEAGRFGQAMSNMSRQAIAAITECYDFGSFSHVVDVGGNRGTLVLDLLGSHPNLRATIFDLPPVIEVAREALKGDPHGARVELVAGSFFEEVPAGADAYLLKHILHDWPDEDCLRILRAIRKAIPKHGKLLVFDALLVPEAPPWAYWLDVHMMILQDGKERTPDEFAELFGATGFELVRAQPTPSPIAILEARCV